MRKISAKIIAVLGLMAFFICSGLALVAFFTSKKALVGILKETMPKVAEEAAVTINDGIQNQLNTLYIMTELDIMDVLKEENADYSSILEFMSNEAKRAGHKQMALVDKKGRAIYNDGTIADLSQDSVYMDVMSGKEVVTEPEMNAQRTGIIMKYAVPVKIDGVISGALIAVRDGMELSEFAGRVKFGDTGEAFIINSKGRTIAHSNKEVLMNVISAVNSGAVDLASSASLVVDTADTSSSATAASVANDTPDASSSASVADVTPDASSSATVSTYTEGESNKEGGLANEIGFENFTKVQRQMTEGVMGFGEYKYHGVSKVSGFAPFEKFGWSIAVSADKDEMLAGLKDLRIAFMYISILFLLAGLVIAYIIGKSISRPIVHLSREGLIMSEGDFSRTMDAKYTRRHDEIGELAKAFNNINTNVSRIIRNVIEETNEVGKAIKDVDDNMYSLTMGVNEMSEIIEKLALKMEENSSAAEEMSATSNEIESAVDSIAGDTQHNAETASEVSNRAAELKATAIVSQQKAQEILMDVAVKLREAIEQSQAVEKIQTLSDAILTISSKTNLLALNAAIEAASAGNAGSGFTVVAEEIKNLANKSKLTVNEIKGVAKMIIESVHVLSDSAEQVLGFIETQVVKDYDMLVETGEQYDKDARLLNDMVSNLSATTEELYASIENMSQAIEQVAVSSEKGSTETTELAADASDIVRRTKEVLNKTNEVRRSTEKLLELVSIFRV